MPIARIPVVLLTGFLGSGKTTLLRALLQDPQWQRTAVLINELGAIGLDHHLAWGAADGTLVLDNGCVCCSVQTDLVGSLEQLFWSRLHRRIPRFDRVVIETTGIADPARIVGLFSAGLVAERYELAAVLCTVDGVGGEQQLLQHPESLSQVASADWLLITKSDLADRVDSAGADRLTAAIGRINAGAVVCRSAGGADAAAQLLACLPHGRSEFIEDAVDPGPGQLVAVGEHDSGTGPPRGSALRPPSFRLANAHAGVSTIALHPDNCASLQALQSGLEGLLQGLQPRLLRVKGIVRVDEDDRPWVVQAVAERLHPFERLPPGSAWLGRNFLVVIARDLSREELRAACAPLRRRGR